MPILTIVWSPRNLLAVAVMDTKQDTTIARLAMRLCSIMKIALDKHIKDIIPVNTMEDDLLESEDLKKNVLRTQLSSGKKSHQTFALLVSPEIQLTNCQHCRRLKAWFVNAGMIIVVTIS